MRKFDFCIPTVGKTVPAGADWFHQIKYYGYRLRIEREGSSVAQRRTISVTNTGPARKEAFFARRNTCRPTLRTCGTPKNTAV